MRLRSFSIADSLLDGELLDPASCEQVLGKRSDGQAWQWGCLEIKQTVTPSKGKPALDQDGNVLMCQTVIGMGRISLIYV